MMQPIKILHIDPDFVVNYFIIRSKAFIRSAVSLEKAVKLLATEKFDLILSEPHNRAILTPQNLERN
jgi:hypothetical protein